METGIQQQLKELREEDPTAYAVLKKHIDTVRKGIEQSDANFPKSGRILECAGAEDKFYAPHVGRTLSLLNDFGVVGIYRKDSNSSRYDLTEYDANRMEAVCRLVHSNSDPNQ